MIWIVNDIDKSRLVIKWVIKNTFYILFCWKAYSYIYLLIVCCVDPIRDFILVLFCKLFWKINKALNFVFINKDL